jgi:hypothetical protein
MGSVMICVATLIINQSIHEFGSDPRDNKNVERATYVCRTDKRYKKQPCLVKFTKVENGVYRATCGEKRLVNGGLI